MKSHNFSERDPFLDGLCLGYDDGNERGEWATLAETRIIIPKLGEVALLLGLEIEPIDECGI